MRKRKVEHLDVPYATYELPATKNHGGKSRMKVRQRKKEIRNINRREGRNKMPANEAGYLGQ